MVVSGVRASIYRKDWQDFANGGLSSYVREVTITDTGPHLGGFPPEVAEYEPTETAPAVRLVARWLNGHRYVHAEPVDKPEGMVGPMFGGTYIAMHDLSAEQCIDFQGAIPLHDRYETVEQYASYD